MPPRNRFSVETLEDRAVPALFGTPWPDADHLTISFAPDGTDVAGAQSNLFSALGAALPTATWQQEIVRAFQSWASQGNVNVNVVSDNGTAFGSAGPGQGSSYYGDIRIAARPLSDNVLAVTNPPDVFSSWAGELILNSNKLFAQGNVAGKYDLYTVLLQESGHALGVGNSADTASVMYENYGVARTGLSAGDVASIQKLYGVRAADAFDLSGANDALTTADAITVVNDPTKIVGDGTAGSAPMVAAGDITTLTDTDYYAYKTAKGQTSFNVAFLTDGISQLRGKLTVYDSANAVVTAATVPVGYKGAFQIAVTGAKADATYRVKVEGATQDVFGIGAYRLAVGTAAAAAVTPPAPSTYLYNDYHTNDTRDKAWALGDARPATDPRWDFVTKGSIYNVGGTVDYDFYKIHTKSDTQKVGVFVVSALDVGTLNPAIEVYDKNGVKLAVEVLSNTGGMVVVQLAGVVHDTDYFVRVAAASQTSRNQGNFGLAIDFRDAPIVLPTFASGTLQGTTTQAFTTFSVNRTQLVYFEAAGTGSATAAVRMTVYDANNVAVLTLVAKGGEVMGGNVLLGPGAYTARFVAGNQNGTPLAAFQFRGRYNLGTDPIGPELTDPTAAPPTTATAAASTLYTFDATTQTTSTFLAASDVYTAPVGTPTSDPLVWLAAPPTDTFFLAVMTDFYSTVWW